MKAVAVLPVFVALTKDVGIVVVACVCECYVDVLVLC